MNSSGWKAGLYRGHVTLVWELRMFNVKNVCFVAWQFVCCPLTRLNLQQHSYLYTIYCTAACEYFHF
jgi:hypothetical protein